MPISGPVVHQQLIDAYAEVQARLESARGSITQAKTQRDQLDDDRSNALVRLAEHYLPELTHEAILQTWLDVRPTVAQILLRKEDHEQRVKLKLDGLTARRQEREQMLLTINQELDHATELQDQIAKQVEDRLSNDQEFKQLSDRAALAEVALERAEANLVEIEQDSVKKIPAFDQSALFKYLYDRGYGTGQYNSRGLTKQMDRWLAKKIDFNKAKQSYEFLRKTPEQMRRIITEDRQLLDTVMEELERRRDVVAKELGLPERIAATTQLEAKRADHLKSLDTVLAESEQTQHELTEIGDSRGTYYREAIGVFREMLSRSDARDLLRHAEKTVEITDDQIVARLMGVEMEMGQLDEAARRRRQELDQMGEFLEAMGRLIQRFRAAQFDSSRSQFVGTLDVFDEVQRARDANDVQDLWERIRSAQRWGPTIGEQVTRIATHPMTQVLINAMAHAAGAAMESHARNAGKRRTNRFSSRGGDSSSSGS
jgi:vacuolar-type H+-ATPase subunit D/Vma8